MNGDQIYKFKVIREMLVKSIIRYYIYQMDKN